MRRENHDAPAGRTVRAALMRRPSPFSVCRFASSQHPGLSGTSSAWCSSLCSFFCCISLRAKQAEPWPPSAPRPFRPGRQARLRQTAAGAPVSLRRTPSGFGLTLRSDGEKQHPRLQCPYRTRRLNRDVNQISVTLMAGMMLCRRQIFIPDVRILPSETVRLHPFAEGCF